MRQAVEGREIKQPLSLQAVLDCKDETRYREVRDAFVKIRLGELMRATKPTVVAAKSFGMHEGFIHPDSVIHVVPVEKIPGFKVDDETVFQKLLDAVRAKRSIPDAVQTVVDDYFHVDHKVRDTSRSSRRVQTYSKRTSEEHLGVREIAGAHISMCAERSAVAQNLITFLGSRSWLMDSYAKLTRRNGTFDDGQHSYNIIQVPGTFLLYDVSHPFEISDEHGKIVETKPAQFNITTEQFTSLQAGTALHLQHQEEQRVGHNQRVVLREYIYGGPGSVRTS